MSEHDAGSVTVPDEPAQPAAIQSAIEQILEAMYFCEANYRGPAVLDSPAFATSLDFSGGLTGEFHVAVSESMAARMATDFLALAPGECSTEQIEAIVKEFGNVACGASMSAWRPHASFRYAVPRPLSQCAPGAMFDHCFSISGFGTDLAVQIRLE